MQMMKLPAIPSLSSAVLHAAGCCKHCYEWLFFLWPCAIPLSLVPHRTPKLSRRGKMCSRHQHESKPSHDSLPQAAVAKENSAKLTIAFWPCNTVLFTMVKQEDKLSVTRSVSTKLLCLFNKMSLVFVFHTTESCISIQTNWNSSRKVGQIKNLWKYLFLNCFS